MQVYIVGIDWPSETFLARKINALVEAGVSVTVCSADVRTGRDPARPDLRFLRIPSLSQPVRLLAFALPLLARKLLADAPATLHAWRTVRAGEPTLKAALRRFPRVLPFIGEQPDIVHYEWNSAAIEHLPLFDLLPCPAVISCRGGQVQVKPHNPEQPKLADGLRATFARAAAVHCVSEAIREEAAAYGLDRAKAWVIRPAVDPDVFRPADPPPAPGEVGRIVSTGSLLWRKGYEYALLAIRRLKERGCPVQLEIIGDGPERQRVLYTIHDLDLTGEVELVGRLKPHEVVERLQRADVFVLSSLSEGISNAVLEAMACGLPVVTTDCGGMREAVTDGVEGFVVPTRDPDALAGALETLVADAGLRRRMGAAARRRITEQFTLDQQAAQFLALYRSLEARDEPIPVVR